MAANGQLPSSSLRSIPGSGPYGNPKLLRAPAYSYRAMHAVSMRRWKVSMALHESSVGRAYRSYARQVLARRIYGGNAAIPGTSNHGWGLAVDLATRQQRWVVDQIGAHFGWAKRWSDASWEWWHLKWRAGVWVRFPTLRYGSRGEAVHRLQRLLRKKGYTSVRRTGFYGDATRSAVRRFQKKKGLRADGVAGPRTWRALRR